MKEKSIKKDSFITHFFIILSLSLIVYGNTLLNSFVYDDFDAIVNNDFVKDIRNIKFLFNKDYYQVTKELSYRPVASLSYLVLYYLFKLNPIGYHFFSLTLHIAVSIVVYFVVFYLFKRKDISLFGSFLFAVNPILTEAINCIAFNEDILVTLFYLLAFISYLKLTDTENQHGKRWLLFVISSGCYILALFSKEMALSFPLVIFVYDVLYKTKKSQSCCFFKSIFFVFKKKYLFYILLTLITIFFFIVRGVILSPPELEFSVDKIYPSLLERIFYVPYLFFNFLKITIFPFYLNADYNFFYPPFFSFSYFFSLFFFIIFLILIFVFFKKGLMELSFALSFFIITLIPVYNIVPIANPLAERYLYLPFFWFIIGIVYLLNIFFKNEKNKRFLLVYVIFFIIIAIYSSFTVMRNRVWQNEFTLWSDTLKKNPESFRANYNIALVYADNSDFKKAIEFYKKAIDIDKNSFKAYNNLGIAYLRIGDLQNAVDAFKEAIKINEKHINAYFNLAVAYNLLQRDNEAIEVFKKIVELNPQDFETFYMIAKLYYNRGDKESSFIYLQKALKIKNDFKDAEDLLKKLQ